MITAKDLVFDYPGKRALDNVSFTIPEHSITALVGPNGAGKTTLMRCLAALETPLYGSIELNSVDVLAEPRECHRQVGYLSDFFGLYDELSVEKCLRFVAACHHIQNIDEAIDEAITLLHLQDYVQTPAGALSRGYRQRLGMAQAIIHKPKVLILDEPASGLDPEARAELADLMLALQKTGVTTLVSSHILSELSEYSSHMLIIEQGRIVDNSPIAAEVSQSIRLRIAVASESTELQTLLEQESDFSIEVASDKEALGELNGDATAAAELLQRLIKAGLTVCEYEVVRPDMQDVYLQRVRQERENQGRSH
ncbi:MAG: ATP-binding cassette domain-containing protein [Gammaproteobacteria bacterium]|nr:ATP-binding cassette domain-containing protein [Gammaproteobacteria bacterium]